MHTSARSCVGGLRLVTARRHAERHDYAIPRVRGDCHERERDEFRFAELLARPVEDVVRHMRLRHARDGLRPFERVRSCSL